MLSNRTLIFLCALLALLLVALHISNRRLESICPEDPGRGLLSSDPDLVVRMRFETPGFTTEILWSAYCSKPRRKEGKYARRCA